MLMFGIKLRVTCLLLCGSGAGSVLWGQLFREGAKLQLPPGTRFLLSDLWEDTVNGLL